MREFLLIFLAAVMLQGCSKPKTASLEESLREIAEEYPGEIGIALLTDDGDTVLVNNEDKYPLMSVFKLHQAISLCNRFEHTGESLDSIVSIRRAELNQSTWSPMLKDHNDSIISISIRDLLDYALTLSDNNASNYLFEHIEPVEATDSFISTIIPRESFQITVTEADMFSDHSLAYQNHSSPSGAASLINKLFTDSIIGSANSDFIRTTLRQCQTGADRISAALADVPEAIIAHKTGSGFRNENGILSAHNDVAFISLPDGRHYALAVLIKDFNGSEAEASEAIERISATVLASFK